MTTEAYIQENKTATLKKGDQVIMHSCMESSVPENKNRIWICQTDSFIARDKSEVVFLENFSGYFITKFLKKAT